MDDSYEEVCPCIQVGRRHATRRAQLLSERIIIRISDDQMRGAAFGFVVRKTYLSLLRVIEIVLRICKENRSRSRGRDLIYADLMISRASGHDLIPRAEGDLILATKQDTG